MSEGTGKREEVKGDLQPETGNGQRQVYLRFVGVRLGVRFEAAQSGPWLAHVDGGMIVIRTADKQELFGEREDLETRSQASELHLQAAVVGADGQLGEWRQVDLAVRQAVEPETGARKTREALRAEVDRLHALRGEEVQLARELREKHGVLDERYAARWAEIQELTERICAAEEELRGTERGEDESGICADILIAVAVAGRGALVHALRLLSDMPGEQRAITNIIDAVDALYNDGSMEVAHG